MKPRWGGRWTFRAFLAAVVAGCLLAQVAAAQSTALVHLVPGQATVGEGQTAAVEVRVENVADLYGLDIRIAFDPLAVEVVDADPNTEGIQVRPGGLLKVDFMIRNVADNGAGTVWFALVQLNPTAEVTGSGIAFVVTFRGRRQGAASPLSVTYQKMATRGGDTIPASVEDGEIRVVEGQQAPPTPTQAAPPEQPTVVVPTNTAVPAAPTLTSVPPTAVPPPTPVPPTAAPTQAAATMAPTVTPVPPTPTLVPPTSGPTLVPTSVRTQAPTTAPTAQPTAASTKIAAVASVAAPTATAVVQPPTRAPTAAPTAAPATVRGRTGTTVALAAGLGVALIAAVVWLLRRKPGAP